ncbi:hypothetical protein NTE_01432 [Candidatus Nitrososphaera evergladensis SR1]|uniref:Uncharacterized protein n=1 Tax=Candidatus Nitrososphaera evergladensis SR1 TaxID=1459636 RepID=A0A075MPK7_9ARCH|nr:hypothetical protein [Candidatus Nitrososphaera evergladensis]AIF83496.1 hypothetical protein NTE_01432 [Candidatus Nitrososphaera evergladensis SR1]
MAQPNKSLLLGAVPGIALAALMVFVIPSSALVGAQNVTTDGLTPRGYVVVSVTRDGQEIYHNEQHNLITNAGKDFISAQIGSDSTGSNGANYIALTNTAITPVAGDTTLSGEITNNGLSRAQGTYAHTNGQSTFTVSKTFTATGATAAQAAGLFTASSGGTMMAENTFNAVSLAANDQLTITWTITLS